MPKARRRFKGMQPPAIAKKRFDYSEPEPEPEPEPSKAAASKASGRAKK